MGRRPPCSPLFPYTTLFRSLGANLAVPPPSGVELVETPSAAELEREALERDADVVIMAAAVADYRPPAALQSKRRSEEHTSELQSHVNLVCRLLLEKKKKNL